MACLLIVAGTSLAPVVACASDTQSFAAEPAKVFTQDAFTVDPGHWEVSMAGALERSHQAFDDNGKVVAKPGSFQDALLAGVVLGLDQGLDLSVSVFWASVEDKQQGLETGNGNGNGPGDLQLELRWQFRRSDGWNLAYLPRLVAPMGKSQIPDNLSPGQPYWSLDNTLVASRVQGRWASSVQTTLSLPVGGDRNGYRRLLALNSGVGYQVTQAFQVELEWLIEQQEFEQAQAAWRSSLALGAVVQVSPWLRLDAAILQGMHGQRADRLNAVVANFVFQF
jgi:hypothetical protein